jgi:hypothetical protein
MAGLGRVTRPRSRRPATLAIRRRLRRRWPGTSAELCLDEARRRKPGPIRKEAEEDASSVTADAAQPVFLASIVQLAGRCLNAVYDVAARLASPRIDQMVRSTVQASARKRTTPPTTRFAEPLLSTGRLPSRWDAALATAAELAAQAAGVTHGIFSFLQTSAQAPGGALAPTRMMCRIRAGPDDQDRMPKEPAFRPSKPRSTA